MKNLWILLVCLGAVNCAMPTQYNITGKYELTQNDIKYLDIVYGKEIRNHVQNNIFYTDTNYQDAPAYYTKGIVYIHGSFDTSTLLHETMHYYQDAYLHKDMTPEHNYSVDINTFNSPMGKEQEASVVAMWYEGQTNDPNTCVEKNLFPYCEKYLKSIGLLQGGT